MNEELKKNDTKVNEEEISFLSLIYSLSQAVWSWLGKQAHPASNQIQKDLVQAKSMIDMLRMLQRKTQGNLNPKEQQILEGILADLELNYVEESSKPVSS
ncbi:MAG: DUF1844 domain-containing protein [Elusimicrobia bacterium]|nr:DUF1844 domain-containing protein [Elusimicrobiota bacterium]